MKIIAMIGMLVCCITAVTAQPADVKKITNVENAYPYWSPDDSWIVYQSNQTGNWEIYTMNADGSDKRQLTRNGYNNITPTISPDGTRIAFVSDIEGDNDIYIMNVNGIIGDKITHNDYADYHPSWSPDGAKLTYGSGPSDPETEIYEFQFINRESTRLTTNDHFDSFSDYSPDGQSIVWIQWLPENNGELFVMDLESGMVKQLRDTPIFEGYCTWNASGNEVYYAHPNYETRRYDIGKIEVSSLESEIVFSSMLHDSRPQISNDGKRMIFNRESDGDTCISILELPQE